jgi:hypothetical protein
MRSVISVTLGFVLALSPVAARSQTPDCQDIPSPPAADLPPGLSIPAIDSTLPFDVTLSSSPSLVNDQKAFDLFSWDSFIALNWPADGQGLPLLGKITDNPTAPRVWESYIAATQVFKTGGADPDPWGSQNSVAKKMVPALKQRERVLFSVTKNSLSDVLQASFGMTKFPPIADLNGAYVFYEIHLNKVEYDYIVANQLYSKAGQTTFLQKPAPTNVVDFPKGDASARQQGCIELKAAWKQMGAGDDPSKFYLLSAFRVDPVTHQPSAQPVTFGLVGLHIITRTNGATKWIWSTFEHVDNAPDVGAVLTPSQHFNFNDPSKPQNPLGFNFRPPNNTPVANPTPTQITRVLNNEMLASPWTQTLNQTMQTALAGSVWQNYRLVTTQWPGPSGQFIPCRVTNTTAETYFQSDAAGGSCMRCHNVARTAAKVNNQAASANFSYLLQNAQ